MLFAVVRFLAFPAHWADHFQITLSREFVCIVCLLLPLKARGWITVIVPFSLICCIETGDTGFATQWPQLFSAPDNTGVTAAEIESDRGYRVLA